MWVSKSCKFPSYVFCNPISRPLNNAVCFPKSTLIQRRLYHPFRPSISLTKSKDIRRYVHSDKDKKQAEDPLGHNHGHGHGIGHGHSHGMGHSHSHGIPKHLEGTHEATIASRVTWVGLWSNLFLGFAKAAAGIYGSSSAMLADAGHTFGDLISDVVTLLAVKWARQPVDKDHPYGHGRYESIGALTVSALLVLTGLGIAHHSYEHFLELTTPTQLALWTAVASIVVKEAIFQATIFVARQQSSELLVANAWHHRSDAISSLMALAGIGFAQLGFPYADPIAGLLVAGFIVKVGLQTGWTSLKELTDTVVDPNFIEQIQRSVDSQEGVQRSLNIRARKMGHYSMVDLIVEVDPLMTVSAAHQVAERARQQLLKEFPRVFEAHIHVRAETHSHILMRPQQQIEADIVKVAKSFKQIEGVSHISCHFLNEKVNVEVNVEVAGDMRVSQLKQVAKELKEAIEKIKDINYADIHLELSEFSKRELTGTPDENMKSS